MDKFNTKLETAIDITPGTADDIEKLGKLYDALNDHLESEINYPGWKRGVYPIQEDARAGIEAGTLFVARQSGEIVGSIILNHQPEEAYAQADWAFQSDYSDVLVIHTLAVHPDCLKRGIGRKLLEFSVAYGKKQGMKALRLDVYENNTPALHLYESMGFQYVGRADLGYGDHGLDLFCLYEIYIGDLLHR